MDILVCVKQVPDTADAEVLLRPDGMGIELEDLATGINEWDNYAVEEAIRLKEAHGGTVTVVTLGSEEAEEVLRRCLAMGADEAVRVDDAPFAGSDAFGVARGLCGVVGRGRYDLVLTGALSGDEGSGVVGPAMAGQLAWPHATLVTSIVPQGDRITVTRELEGGVEELLELALPAVVTIQTGINEPRYVSIMGIRKVRAKDIPVLEIADLGVAPEQVGADANWLRLERMSLPPSGRGAELIQGTPAEIARRILGIVREKGGVA